jgi:hypothetical protein
MYVRMFRHNYLSVNGIVSFPSFTWLYKFKEEYKQGEMWHSAQRAKISEEICMFQPGRCQATGNDSYPRKPTMRNCWKLGNGSVTTDISTATIDRGGYKRKGDSFIQIIIFFFYTNLNWFLRKYLDRLVHDSVSACLYTVPTLRVVSCGPSVYVRMFTRTCRPLGVIFIHLEGKWRGPPRT